MYESYWKLNGRPFSQTAEPAYFYRSQSCQTALLRIRYAVENLCGPVLVPGLSGNGKSCLVRYFASEFPKLRPFVHLVFPTLAADEQLRMIQAELCEEGVPSSGPIDTVLRDIRSALRRHAAQGRRPLLFFDDAQLMTDDGFQQVIQPLLSLAEADANIQLTVLLAGQPSLTARIRRFGQISERITVTTPLNGFTAAETAEYVRICLSQAGCTHTIFTADALSRLFDVSSGNPRRINRLCDMALLVGFAEQKTTISSEDIDSIAGELLPAAA
jgi:general secretion pathway protein A